MLKLDQECRFIKGVGPVRADRLKKLGIFTVDDLLTHYPRKHYDRRNIRTVAGSGVGEEVSLMGQVLTAAKRRTRSRRSIITAAVGDETGIIQVVWFNQDYIFKQLRAGHTIVLNGEITHYRGSRQLVNPEFEMLGEELDREFLHAGRIVPVYGLTAGISQRFLRGLIARALDGAADALFENLPLDTVNSMGFPPRSEAIREIHFPQNQEAYDRAVKRIKFEELFFLQMAFSLHRRNARTGRGIDISVDYSLERRFLQQLPFTLTGAQRRVLDEIHHDFEAGTGMQRLLQGDVGSGKTVVAGAAVLSAVQAGYQAAIMAPTEILAVQHLRTLRDSFESLGVRTGLLIGALGAPEKREVQAGIAGGSVDLVIGTHALIQENVTFRNLGLAVIDEQHRFGVRQRAALLGGGNPPHLLVMTATPIPRTLALTAYADLDLSVIDEMPPGRTPVTTRIVRSGKRDDMLRFVREQIDSGARAYFLYPVIDETEANDLQAATSAHRELSNGLFAGTGVGLLHGKMSYGEKERAMREFASGATRLLVSTTVVEVGVHVPEATIMVINHPERFGLSQLHQLRGRVGRGSGGGYCFLYLDEGVSGTAQQRLNILTRLTDGFKIAEEDLKIRGPGEFFGIRQHGVPGFKLANPISDRALVEKAHEAVDAVLSGDPRLRKPESAGCRRYLQIYSSLDIGLVSAG